jgi:hypothetical protein
MPPLRAPARDGEVLAVPGFDAIPALVEENRRRLDRSDVRIDDLWDGDLRQFRINARISAIIQAWQYLGRPLPYKPGTVTIEHIPSVSDDSPLIVSGHQPELFHPGVWVKNFALAGLAKRLGSVALNLIVDNDDVKTTAIRAPLVRGPAPTDVGATSVWFDTAPELPFEDYWVSNPDEFSTFADRVESLLPPTLGEPLLRKFWAEVRRHPKVSVGEAFAIARRRLEREWGCDNLELPVSQLSDEYFARFAFGIFGNADKFAEVYNSALRTYRRRNGLKSDAHPVPNLASEGDWQEVPLWAWTSSNLRRGRVWVNRTRTNRMSFRFDNGLADITVPYPFTGISPAYSELFNSAFRLRPRALTLTLFARLCLADFFIHGIGGGKYDEVTDEIMRSYFGVEPPVYQVLSATLHLPLPAFQTTSDDVHRAERRVRDLKWNPQAFIPEGAASDLVARHAALAASEPPYREHAARQARYRELQEVKEQLRARVADQVPDAERELARSRAELEANAILQRRDYSWVLYPEETLRPFLTRFLN